MASAIIAGLLRASLVSASQITAVDLAQGALDKPERRARPHHRRHCPGWQQRRHRAAAVKPQVVQAVLPEVLMGSDVMRSWVSILAGVSCATLEAGLPAGLRVVRSVPNTPSLVGRSATALAAAPRQARRLDRHRPLPTPWASW
ncbi:MAG: hypothetical protein IPH72_32325 [Sandaracinaceae bacterium]|nr:hypothetical protein [Sandaracinaceae bacterium]